MTVMAKGAKWFINTKKRKRLPIPGLADLSMAHSPGPYGVL